MAAADDLQRINVLPDLRGVLVAHVAGREKDAGDRALLDKFAQFVRIAEADDDMASDHFDIMGVGRQHLTADPMKACL